MLQGRKCVFMIQSCVYAPDHVRPEEAAVLGAIDYKLTFARTYESDEALQKAYSDCHKRSAERVLKELLANGGESILITLARQSEV